MRSRRLNGFGAFGPGTRQRFAAALSVALSLVLLNSAGSAHADNGKSSSPSGTSSYSETTLGPDATAVDHLAPGTRIRKVDQKGNVTTATATTAACTVSVTAYQPVRVWHNGQNSAEGKVSGYLSSGCVYANYLVDTVKREACGFFGCSWQEQGSAEALVKPGYTVTLWLWKVCANSNSDQWQTKGQFRDVNPTYSGNVWLACGG